MPLLVGSIKSESMSATVGSAPNYGSINVLTVLTSRRTETREAPWPISARRGLVDAGAMLGSVFLDEPAAAFLIWSFEAGAAPSSTRDEVGMGR
jgi:hypothetical protein